MAEEARKSNGLDLVLEVWSRRKWLVMLIFLGGFAAAASLAMFLPNAYSAEAKVLIERQRIPEAFVKSTVTSALGSRIQTISQEILSPSRLEGLITRFDLYTDLRDKVPLKQVIAQMRGDISVELKQAERERSDLASGTFTIGFMGDDPQKVALVANALASLYIEENLRIREGQAVGTAQFLQSQLEEMKKKLDEQERRVTGFKERYIGGLPQQQEANLATLKQLNEQLRLNSDTQIRISERRAMLARQLAEVEGFKAAGSPDAIATRITQLHQELTELRTRFSDMYPDVIQLKAEIAALEERLRTVKNNKEPEKKREWAAPTNPYILQLKQAIGEIDLETKALKAEAEGLRHAIANYQRYVEQAPQRELEFQILARDYETTKEVYHSMLKRQGEAQLAESMEQRQKGEQLQILAPAMAADQPAKPNRSRLIAMGLLLSLGLAAGVVVLAEWLDTSFHAVDDLRALSQVPVLVSIPRIIIPADRSRRRWRLCFGAAAVMLGLVLIVGSSFLIAKGRVPVVGELAQSRLLRV
jgi:polysaccharide chain length determinant protein (PEP-CTERM system associated)